MSIKDEIESYEKVKVSLDTGEIELWDHVIFPNVIRKRQIRLILDVLERGRHRKILDYGCGAGWLSKILLSKSYDVVGIDASSTLVGLAKKLCGRDSFVVGDCMDMPFANDTFDCLIGSAILHHLEPAKALSECRRVTIAGGTLLLMEPNKLNPSAAIGRKITNIRTKDEEPFHPGRLKKALVRAGWVIYQFQCLFPYSFSLSYVVKTLRMEEMHWLRNLCPLVEASEKIFERLPLFDRLGYEIVVVAGKGDKGS